MPNASVLAVQTFNIEHAAMALSSWFVADLALGFRLDTQLAHVNAWVDTINRLTPRADSWDWDNGSAGTWDDCMRYDWLGMFGPDPLGWEGLA